MGAGIAQVAATSGLQARSAAAAPPWPRDLTRWTPPLQVVLVDRAAEQLERALAGMRRSLGKLASKGALAEDPDAVLRRLQRATDLEARV